MTAKRQRDVQTFLAGYLKGGARSEGDIRHAAERHGIAPKDLLIARKRLGIACVRDWSGRWYWQLNDDTASNGEAA